MSERSRMEQRAAVQRWAPLTGVLAVVLWVVAVAVMGEGPAGDATAAQTAAYFEENATSWLVGGSLFGIGCLAFVLFLGVVRSRMTSVDGGDRGPATFVFGAGLLTAAMVMATQVPTLSLAIRADDSEVTLSPAAAEALWAAGDGFFIMGAFAASLFLLATCVVALRTRLFAAWFAWVGIVFGVVMLVPPIGWAGLIFGFPLWLLAASMMLAMHRPSVSIADTARTTPSPRTESEPSTR